MIEELQQFDLPHDPLRINQILIGLGHLFNSDLLIRLLIERRANDTISASSYALDVFVFLVHFKGGLRALESDLFAGGRFLRRL